MAAVTGMIPSHNPRSIFYTTYIINFINPKMEKPSAKTDLDYVT